MEPINTSPIHHFIKKVHGADLSNSKEIKLDIKEAKTLSTTISLIMIRLEGDLEKLINQKLSINNEIIEVQLGKDNNW